MINSVSEALELASPRSAKFMLDRFGLDSESKEDERCLLINPAVWRVPAEGGEIPFVDCVMERDELGLGLMKGWSEGAACKHSCSHGASGTGGARAAEGAPATVP